MSRRYLVSIPGIADRRERQTQFTALEVQRASRLRWTFRLVVQNFSKLEFITGVFAVKTKLACLLCYKPLGLRSLFTSQGNIKKTVKNLFTTTARF